MAAKKAEGTPRRVGRPRKAEVAAREAKLKREEKARVDAILEELPPIFKCTRCGMVAQDPVGKFYAINNNTMFDGNESRSNICVTCANKYYEEYAEKYDDPKLALMLTCMHLGAYFSEPLYETMKQAELEDPEKNAFSLGKYIRYLNGAQYKKQTFLGYLFEVLKKHQAFTPQEELREKEESKWKLGDQRNKVLCLKEVKYDCFDDPTYSIADRKFLFNALAGYLSMGDIAADKHKLDAVIEIVKTSLQVEYINRALTKEYRAPEPDMQKIDKWTEAKTKLSKMVNLIAKDNAISSIGSGRKAQSATAVTAIMKEMIDNGVVEAKVNLVDIKMCDVFQSIAQISSKALMEELNITGDEYAEMVGKQADIIRKLNDEIMELKEELRLMTIRAHDAEAKKGRKTVNRVELNIGSALIEEQLAEQQEGELA